MQTEMTKVIILATTMLFLVSCTQLNRKETGPSPNLPDTEKLEGGFIYGFRMDTFFPSDSAFCDYYASIVTSLGIHGGYRFPEGDKEIRVAFSHLDASSKPSAYYVEEADYINLESDLFMISSRLELVYYPGWMTFINPSEKRVHGYLGLSLISAYAQEDLSGTVYIGGVQEDVWEYNTETNTGMGLILGGMCGKFFGEIEYNSIPTQGNGAAENMGGFSFRFGLTW